MILQQLQNFLLQSSQRNSRNLLIFWLSLSFTISILYSITPLTQAFSHEYVVQDDARQHIFWMARFIDPNLFPHDLLADYFQSVAPKGYAAFYQGLAHLGIHPYFLSKIIPLFLALIATGYCFFTTLSIFPAPLAGFLASLFLNQNLWMQDDLVSGTPVAFVYPIFLAFLYYFFQSSLWGITITIILLGLFYPQLVLISSGLLILELITWKEGRIQLSRDAKIYQIVGMALSAALLVLLPYVLAEKTFGSVMTVTEAKILLPEFFTDNLTEFWFCGKRTGIIPAEWCEITDDFSEDFLRMPPQFWGTISLPFLALIPAQFSLIKQVKYQVFSLLKLVIVSIILYGIAYLFLFKLHLPNRYTEHTLRLSLAIAGGIAFTIGLNRIFNINLSSKKWIIWGQLILSISLGIYLLIYPTFLEFFPNTQYEIGTNKTLYEFLEKQPKESLIASILDQTDNLPTFTQHSILVSPGFAARYHQGYYRQIHQRAIDLIQAQYHPNLDVVKQFIQNYGIDLWLLDANAFDSKYLPQNHWLEWFKVRPTDPLALAANQAYLNILQGKTPALARLIQDCTVFNADNMIVLQASCIINAKLNQP